MIETYVALDVEATGMDPLRHEIIEVALVAFTRDGEVERFQSLVRPRRRLTLDIGSLTGIRAEELAEAPTFPEMASTIRRILSGRPVVGQSIQFDLGMLQAAGISAPPAAYDTYELATLLLPDLPVYSLAGIAAGLGVEPPVGHRAMGDAQVCADVFRKLLDRLDEHDTSTLEQLAVLARTAGWSSASLFAAVAMGRLTGPLFVPTEAGGRGPHELVFLTPRERPEPLRATGAMRPVDLGSVRSALAASGPLSRVVPNYEHRPQQEAMATAVAEALNDDGRLLVEAGTGTGKSVAYLLPAALHATARGETVVVSTNTLALQDQLQRKDVPDLRRALTEHDSATDLDVAVLKGRTNYLCLRRWFALQRQPAVDAADAGLRAKVLMWLGETQTGDRSELRLAGDEDAHWRQLSAEEEACNPARCPFNQRNQCFLFRARREAEHAHLVIVNHALLLSDVMAGSRVLPQYDHLIIDEAHHLEDQATTQFGFTVSERDVAEYVDRVIRTDGPALSGTLALAAHLLGRLAEEESEQRRAAAAGDRNRLALDRAERARATARELFARMNEFIGRHESDRGGYDRTLRLTDGVRRDSSWVEVELLWERLEADLRLLDEQLRWYLDAVEHLKSAEDEENVAARDELAMELGLVVRAGTDLAIRLQSVIGAADRSLVYWIERSVFGDHVSLHAAPLHVGQVLREQLFDPLRSLVLTSATLTTDGTFDYVAERLGLEEPEELVVRSPFDFERSTLLYLAEDMPEPGQQGYQRRLNETLIELCDATRGRALILFTSHAALQATYKAIRGPLEDLGVLVLAQRLDGNPRQLVERLRHTPNVVVLGTATFWEGVDVVGPALSLLVITKLPFAVPSDPVFAARSELFEEPFLQYAVPQAVLKFKQGFGRLIRSSHDRGVCAVLDRRVLTKRYGASFVQSLPQCSVTIGSTFDLPTAAADWLATT